MNEETEWKSGKIVVITWGRVYLALSIFFLFCLLLVFFWAWKNKRKLPWWYWLLVGIMSLVAIYTFLRCFVIPAGPF